MEFKAINDLIIRLRARKVEDAIAGSMRDPDPLELEAAATIESMLFQLNARIGVAKAENKEATGG